VLKNVAKYFVTPEGIFYTLYSEDHGYVLINGIKHRNIFGSKIYKASLDGKENNLISVLDGIDLGVWSDVFAGYHEGKLAVRFMEKAESDYYSSGWDYVVSDSILIIDTESGSYIKSSVQQ
jgi:hypothetical protein